jgi:hypothetical protein
MSYDLLTPPSGGTKSVDIDAKETYLKLETNIQRDGGFHMTG